MAELSERRAAAALASAGTSSDPIMASVVSAVARLGVRGQALDFGSGRGELLKRLVATGAFDRLVGSDLMARPESLPAGVSWISQDLNEPLGIASESFDLITAVEVIEHLENPRSLAREWYRLLRPGGRVIVTTPNNESVRALLHLLFRGHFVGFADSCYPAHITPVLRKDMVRILREAGFEPPAISYVPYGGIPRLPSVSWQTISAGLLEGRRWSDTMIALARRPS